MYDVVAIGESLIDFTPSGVNESGTKLFGRNPGGAPANVLAMNAKLGGKTAFIGKVGNDDFGKFLIATMQQAGIDCSAVCIDKEIPTTLAFVQLDEKGDRSFTFYRKPGADVMLSTDELPSEMIKNCKIFHFGSVSLTDEPCRTATIEAAKAAKKAGAIVSYDPNYRPFLWPNANIAKDEILQAMPFADLLKVSEEEMELLTAETDIEIGAKKLMQMGPTAVFVTMGAKGAYYATPTANGQFSTYDVNTVDTTGAGDAFWGAIHYCLVGKTLEKIKNISEQEWEHNVNFANAAGSLTTTAKGAIPAMPDKESIYYCMKHTKLL